MTQELLPKSLQCDECKKLFRTNAAVEFHATKTGHQNFSQSAEEIKPLTEEEKKAKLEELKLKMTQKKLEKQRIEEEERKQSEIIRRVGKLF
jgi:hypothetical protein